MAPEAKSASWPISSPSVKRRPHASRRDEAQQVLLCRHRSQCSSNYCCQLWRCVSSPQPNGTRRNFTAAALIADVDCFRLLSTKRRRERKRKRERGRMMFWVGVQEKKLPLNQFGIKVRSGDAPSCCAPEGPITKISPSVCRTDSRQDSRTD